MIIRLVAFSCFAGLFASVGDTNASETDTLISETDTLIKVSLRTQEPTSVDSPRFHRLEREEQLKVGQLAVIVCDMWDLHHSVNAVRRVKELAPRIDQLLKELRSDGATIIHAPSSCMSFYEKHPARMRAVEMPSAANYPIDIDRWCDQIPSEEQTAYPLDQSAGGEDDDVEELRLWAKQLSAHGRNPRAPWLRQTDLIAIDPESDFVSDSGQEIWNILEAQNVSHVLMVGVHTNMCVLGRPFGLRRLVAGGRKVFLVRDLTDTMYDPRAWPHTNHFSGTDLIIDHIERYVCPTISSEQILGGAEFRFSEDNRPQLTMIIADDEYKTEESLPYFAAKHLGQRFRVTVAYGSDTQRHQIVSLQDVAAADALLISVRRRWLPEADLELIRQFARSGRPMIGIRTASHAFSMRSEKPPEGYEEWPEFDADIWGGNYTNHYGKQLRTELAIVESSRMHPILEAIGLPLNIDPGGSLYRTSPLSPAASPLILGNIAGLAGSERPEPVAWTYVRADGGRSFYTSLGHPDDFAQSQFEALLSAGIHWACRQPLSDLESVQQQNERYGAGQGRQR